VVFLLGLFITRLEKSRSGDSSVVIKEIDDRAKLTEELWEEVRLSRVDRARLNNELLEERKRNLKLELQNERLSIQIDKLKTGEKNGEN